MFVYVFFLVSLNANPLKLNPTTANRFLRQIWEHLTAVQGKSDPKQLFFFFRVWSDSAEILRKKS